MIEFYRPTIAAAERMYWQTKNMHDWQLEPGTVKVNRLLEIRKGCTCFRAYPFTEPNPKCPYHSKPR